MTPRLLKEFFGSRDWQICPLFLEFPLLPDPLLLEFFKKEIKEKVLGLCQDIHYCWISVTLGSGIARFNCSYLFLPKKMVEVWRMGPSTSEFCTKEREGRIGFNRRASPKKKALVALKLSRLDVKLSDYRMLNHSD